MKVMIVLHSQSGHTAEMARAIAAELRENGHDVDMELLRTQGKVAPGQRNVEFRRLPEIEDCQALIIGGPVLGFRASPVLLSYLRTLETLKGRKAICFVTKGLPFKFTGGPRAIRAVNNLLEMLGAQVLEAEDFHWGFRPSKVRLEQAVRRIAERIGRT